MLVIEDAPEFIEMLVPLLQREGYVTDVASDGEAGVEAARDFAPDVIVLDLDAAPSRRRRGVQARCAASATPT